MPLNFGGQKRSGAFDTVWPSAVGTLVFVRSNFNVKIWGYSCQTFLRMRFPCLHDHSCAARRLATTVANVSVCMQGLPMSDIWAGMHGYSRVDPTIFQLAAQCGATYWHALLDCIQLRMCKRKGCISLHRHISVSEVDNTKS